MTSVTSPLKSLVESRAATPLVTVIICVYNAGEYFRPSLLSIIEQTYRNLDIIIIDDGSTDGCFDTVADILVDRRIRVFHQDNATKPVAMNRALALAEGEYYVIHDADDISHSTRVERQIDVMLHHPACAVVFCGHELILNGRRLAPLCEHKDEQDCAREISAFQMPAHDPTAMFRLSFVRDMRYDESMQLIETFDYILRVGERYPVRVLGECLYSYRILFASVTRRDPGKRDVAVARALTAAHTRRGIADTLLSSTYHVQRSKNSVADNNLAAHFIRSVLSQRAAGAYWNALRTGWQCLRLHPFDPHYYKAIIYALIPRNAVAGARAMAQRLSLTTSTVTQPGA